jgi:hypothetical protein
MFPISVRTTLHECTRCKTKSLWVGPWGCRGITLVCIDGFNGLMFMGAPTINQLVERAKPEKYLPRWLSYSTARNRFVKPGNQAIRVA